MLTERLVSALLAEGSFLFVIDVLWPLHARLAFSEAWFEDVHVTRNVVELQSSLLVMRAFNEWFHAKMVMMAFFLFLATFFRYVILLGQHLGRKRKAFPHFR